MLTEKTKGRMGEGIRLLTELTVLALVCRLGMQAVPGPCTYGQSATGAFPEPAVTMPRVALLQSDYSLSYFGEKGLYEQTISKWQAALSEMRVEHRRITDSELETGALAEFAVLVLPAAVCLSEDGRETIRGFLNQGKGVVATWGIGARSEDGEWIGWDFLKELTNSRDAGHIVPKPGVWLTFIGDSPLSIGLGPGFRIELYSGQQIAITRSRKDAYWSAWSLSPRRITGDSDSDVAVAREIYSKGRTVWFGFHLTDVNGDSPDQKALKTLLLNAIRWAGRVPMSHTWYWPDNHHAAAVFAQDVEYLFHNAANSVEVLREAGVPGSFFCVSDFVRENQDLVKTFAEIGEVGTHSDDHTLFKGQPFDLQLDRLQKSVTDLKRISGVEVKGLRPPEELYDEATLKAWAILGGEYIFGQPDYNPRVVPELVSVGGDRAEDPIKSEPLVIIRRAVTDDYVALVVDSLTDNEEILRRHKSELNWIYNLSGLYTFPYHSNLYCLPDRVGILAGMVRYAKTLDLWLAAALDVSRWWKVRDKVSAEVRPISEGRLLLSVENGNSDSVANLSVVVYLPKSPKTVKIESDLPDAPSPKHHLDESRLVVHTDTLKPNSIQTYTITLE